jgi:hypothetical protein
MNKQNITFVKGNDVPIATLTFQDSAGDAIDITEWTIFLTFKPNLALDDNDPGVVKRTTTVHSDPTHGKTNLILTNSDTSSMSGVYFWDAKYKDENGIIQTFMSGTATVLESVTERTT